MKKMKPVHMLCKNFKLVYFIFLNKICHHKKCLCLAESGRARSGWAGLIFHGYWLFEKENIHTSSRKYQKIPIVRYVRKNLWIFSLLTEGSIIPLVKFLFKLIFFQFSALSVRVLYPKIVDIINICPTRSKFPIKQCENSHFSRWKFKLKP